MSLDRKKLGHLFSVENKQPHPAANDNYYLVLTDLSGQLTPMLFTERELMIAINRAHKNPEDLSLLED